MSDRDPIVAAGAVVLRRRKGVAQVLLVHRPKYDDWSFPKGKLDPGEGARTAAVREVLEETGAAIRLGPRLTDQTYVMKGDRGTKLVHYWTGRVLGEYDASSYAANAEIDEVDWFDLDAAEDLLSYDRDRLVLDEARPFHRRTVPLVVLRHADATSRKKWNGDETERPLTARGKAQATGVVPDLRAYGVRWLVSSSSRRCWTTLAPYGVHEGLDIEVTDHLTEAGASRKLVRDEVEQLLDLRRPAVLCSHRPVLPQVFDALGIDEPPLEPGGMVAVHHRRGRVVAVERVRPHLGPATSAAV